MARGGFPIRFEEFFAQIEKEHYTREESAYTKRIASARQIIIAGAGAVGHLLAENGSIAEKLVAFCDNYKTGCDEQFQVPILHPSQLLPQYRDAVVIVAAARQLNQGMYDQLIELGFPPENICRYYSGRELYDVALLKQHYDGYKWAYGIFKDEISRTILLNRMRAYLYYAPIEHSPPEDQYMQQDAISFTRHEVVVDGGCYTGDTSLEFIKRVHGEYHHIHCFEPDAANLNTARENLKAFANVTLNANGLWSCGGQHKFSLQQIASKMDAQGCFTIDTIALDSYFSNKGPKEQPTFIKMDIEGAEKNALLGSADVIKANRPKLAICVYHKPEDIYELPQLLLSYCPDYHLTLRQYTDNLDETVLYAL